MRLLAASVLFLLAVFALLVHAVSSSAETALLKKLSNAAIPPDNADIIIVATVDGTLHGIHRRTGKLLWVRRDEWGSLVSVNQIVKKKTSNLGASDSEESADDLFIVEPVGAGNLYKFKPGSSIQEHFSTVKELVDAKTSFVDGEAYIGSSESRIIAMDPFTGKVLRVFGNQKQDILLDGPFEENLDHAIFLGRTEYMVHIYDRFTNELRWNITFGEFQPTNVDILDKIAQFSCPPGTPPLDTLTDTASSSKAILPWKSNRKMDIQTFSAPNGLFGIIDKSQSIEWSIKFDSPAISAFRLHPSSSDFHKYRIAQSYPTAKRQRLRDIFSTQPAYIGAIDGSHYLLSNTNFQYEMLSTINQQLIDAPPVCTGSQCAQSISMKPVAVDSDGVILNADGDVCPDGSCLIGMHALRVVSDPPSVMHKEIKKVYAKMKWFGMVLRGFGFIVVIGFGSVFASRLRMRREVRRYTKEVEAVKESEVNGEQNRAETVIVTASPKARRRRKKKAEVVEQDIDSDADQTLAEENDGNSTLKNLVVSSEILGYGSHGTMVFKGEFEGRQVAIKRLLLDFYDVASHEVQVLQDSDDHPNVVRYYFREKTDRFMYIALELCPASLYDLIERPTASYELATLRVLLKPQKVLHGIISGIQYLHSLQIVHRDIKPQNILVAPEKNKKERGLRILVSDFGLSKRLDDDQSSFHHTVAGGTAGWRAPEILIAASQLDKSNDETSGELPVEVGGVKVTRKIDIFSTGCLFYYVLTNGRHPFGERFSREGNIIRGVFKLDGISDDTPEGWEVKDLIKKMISKDPKKRPDATTVLRHPYFWTPAQRLSFLQDASDRFEIEERDPPSAILRILERNSSRIIGNDWQRRVDHFLLENLGKYRKYDGSTVRDLLRALRNKKHHYQDLPANVQNALGPLPEGFLKYFTSRYPGLLLHIYYVIVDNPTLRSDPIFSPYLTNSN